MNQKWMKTLSLWLVLGIVTVIFINLLNFPTAPPRNELVFSEFMSKVERGEVSEVTIKEHQIEGIMKDGVQFMTYAADYPNLVEVMRQNGVRIIVKPPDSNPWYLAFLYTWGPFLLLIAI